MIDARERRTMAAEGASVMEQALAARVAEQAQRSTTMHPDAEIEAEHLERLAATDAALTEAHERVRAAEQRLAEHQQAMPTEPSGVSAWAKQKTEITAEVEAYGALRDRAQAARDIAQGAVAAAYLAWFRNQHEAAVGEWRAMRQAGQEEYADWQRKGQELQRAIGERIQAKGAYINDLRRHVPPGVTIQMLATDEEAIRGSFGL